MSVITTIATGDDGATSRTVLNANFANLNADKVETTVLDTDTALTANSDAKVATQKAVKAYVDAGGNVNASETARGIVEEATQAEVDARTATGSTGASLFVNPSKLTTKFGGTGADGALAISSGTTSIDLGGAAYFEKNYSSISITGTGALTFFNQNSLGTIIVLKSKGAVTITSSATSAISTVGNGAAGGAGTGTVTAQSGNIPTGLFGTVDNAVQGLSGSSTVPTGGLGGAQLTQNVYSITPNVLKYRRYIIVAAGAGGAGGSGGGTTATIGATGGAGGGVLIIECAGAINFTGTINTSGGNAPANATTDTGRGAGGGGGGGAGMCVILYNILTSVSGTITSSGGNGSISSAAISSTGNAGAGGGGAGCHGGVGANGGGFATVGSSAGANSGAGGGGGGGGNIGPGFAGGTGGSSMASIVALNTLYM